MRTNELFVINGAGESVGAPKNRDPTINCKCCCALDSSVVQVPLLDSVALLLGFALL